MLESLKRRLDRHRRLVAALLWGAVGFMAFLVLLQGYALAAAPLLSLSRGAVVALLVGAVTAGCAYRLEHRIAAWATRRAQGETEAHGGDDKSKS